MNNEKIADPNTNNNKKTPWLHIDAQTIILSLCFEIDRAKLSIRKQFRAAPYLRPDHTKKTGDVQKCWCRFEPAFDAVVKKKWTEFLSLHVCVCVCVSYFMGLLSVAFTSCGANFSRARFECFNFFGFILFGRGCVRISRKLYILSFIVLMICTRQKKTCTVTQIWYWKQKTPDKHSTRFIRSELNSEQKKNVYNKKV